MAQENTRKRSIWSGIACLVIVIVFFGYIGHVMGVANMMKTIMATGHDLILNTCLFLMAICVLTGALGKIFVEFGVVDLLEKLLKPLMKPLFNLPGIASLGAIMTFLSDNPAIISLSRNNEFSKYFKKFQFISLTNFGTAFGMGLLVLVFMIGFGYFWEPLVGFFGAFCGCIVSTRLMQRAVLKAFPNYLHELPEISSADEEPAEDKPQERKTGFVRLLDSLLDGGKSGVDVGIAIIPGVVIISSLVMILTFGEPEGGYSGKAYEGVGVLPWLAGKANIVFEYLFGFGDPHLIAFPITSLGAVGAALGLMPGFIENGWVDGNAVAVFTAIGMCWSGYLSTHTAMLDSMGFRNLTSKAITAHTIGGLAAAIIAHWVYVLIAFLVM